MNVNGILPVNAICSHAVKPRIANAAGLVSSGTVVKADVNIQKEVKKMNKNLLRSIMVLNYDNNKDLAEYLGISTSTLSCKMNETNGAEFNQSEIRKIKTRYELTPDQIDQIFFS